jgi:hypothetical protein
MISKNCIHPSTLYDLPRFSGQLVSASHRLGQQITTLKGDIYVQPDSVA